MNLSHRLANAAKHKLTLSIDAIVDMFSMDAIKHRQFDKANLSSQLSTALSQVAANAASTVSKVKRIVIDSSPYSKTKVKPPSLDCSPYRKAGK